MATNIKKIKEKCGEGLKKIFARKKESNTSTDVLYSTEGNEEAGTNSVNREIQQGNIEIQVDPGYEEDGFDLPLSEDGVYRETCKMLIASEKRSIFDSDDMDWFSGTVNLDKAKNYLGDSQVEKGSLLEASFKELVINGEVTNREIQSIKVLEGFSYNIKNEVSTVKNIYELGFAKKGIEFENGHTYSEYTFLQGGISYVDGEDDDRYRKTFMYEGDSCNETYLEICKDGVETGDTITLKAEKIRDDILFSTSASINSCEHI